MDVWLNMQREMNRGLKKVVSYLNKHTLLIFPSLIFFKRIVLLIPVA